MDKLNKKHFLSFILCFQNSSRVVKEGAFPLGGFKTRDLVTKIRGKFRNKGLCPSPFKPRQDHESHPHPHQNRGRLLHPSYILHETNKKRH